MGDAKSIWQSRTLWLNALTLLLVLLDAVVLHEAIPAEWVRYALVANAVANAGLRLITNQPIALKGQQ